MDNKFSAQAQALGYFYQARYALFQILENLERTELSIENLDDITFEKDGNPVELLQLKHHINRKASLSDTSDDLWKTLGIWSTRSLEKSISFPETMLTLVTTSSAPNNSVATFLRPKNRNYKLALEKLLSIAQNSKNKKLKKSFETFLELSQKQQEMLIKSIYILDNATNIANVENEIKKEIKIAVRQKHLEGLYERLEGWWFNKVVKHLMDKSITPIKGIEVHNKIREIAEQFKPESLPIDFLNAIPPNTPDPEGDNRLFVVQLRQIAIQNKRIEKAILDYYRAFEQRSKWVREELLIGDDLEEYEKKLIDEWDRYFLMLQDDFPIEKLNEQEMKKFGRGVYNWVNNVADIRIRDQVTEPYVMRGSYHILADQNPPPLYWHPKFIEKLKELLIIPNGG
jgi:hypothetical protein